MIVFGKGVVFVQKWLHSGISDCIQAKLLYSDNIVVFGPKWLYSGKLFFVGQKWLYSGKAVEFGKKWLNSCKSVCHLAKVVVFGQGGCIRSKWL